MSSAQVTAPCQICGRLIGSKNGKIAHHGYRRPMRYSGQQTKSCYGARYRPFTVAHDAVDNAIAITHSIINQTRAYRDALQAGKITTIVQRIGTGATRVQYIRFVDVTPETIATMDIAAFKDVYPVGGSKQSGWRPTWDELVAHHVNKAGREIAELKQDLEALTTRRAEWVAPKAGE